MELLDQTVTLDAYFPNYFSKWLNHSRDWLFHRAYAELTIFKRYCSKDSTVAKGSIFNILPVLSINAVSPGARSNRNLNLLVSIYTEMIKILQKIPCIFLPL